MALERRITPSEAIYVPGNVTVVATAVLQGRLSECDERSFRRAFETLSTDAPLLRGLIDRDDRGDRFVVPEGRQPVVVVRNDGDEGYRDEVRHAVDSATALSRLLLVRGPERSYVVLMVHHSVADGRALRELYQRFWGHYVGVTRDAPTSSAPTTDLPASMEEVLRRRFGWAEPPVVPRELSSFGGGGPSARREVLRTRLSAEETAAQVAATRAQRLRPHAYICGAVLLALRAGSDVAGPVRLACSSSVDLRTRARPPVTATEVTNFSGGHRAEVEVCVDDKPADIGNRVVSQLERALTTGGWQSLVVDFANPPRAVAEDIPNIVVSNLGRVSEFTSRAGPVVSDFHIFATFSQQQAVCFTGFYGGRLGLNISYCPNDVYTTEFWQRFGRQVIRQLRSI